MKEYKDEIKNVKKIKMRWRMWGGQRWDDKCK